MVLPKLLVISTSPPRLRFSQSKHLYVAPELRLGDEYCVAGLSLLAVVIYGSVGFPPEISEAVKLQSLYAEKVVAGPYGCQLHRNILVGLADGLIENVRDSRVFCR